MKLSKSITLVGLILCVFIGFFIGMYISSNKNVNKSKEGITIETNEIEASAKSSKYIDEKNKYKINAISDKTKIVKKDIYVKGDPYEVLINQDVTDEVIGMDKDLFSKHVEKDGYTVEEFTDEKVVFSKKIDKWPDNMYVLKLSNKSLAIYKVDSSNELKQVESTEIIEEQLSESEIQELNKGKVYDSVESIKEVLGDYSS